MYQTPNKASHFKSNFSFISDKSTLKDQICSDSAICLSSERSITYPQTAPANTEIERFSFKTSRNFTSPSIGVPPCKPRALKQLNQLAKFLEPIFAGEKNDVFEKSNAENEILNAIIMVTLALLDKNTKQNFCLNEVWNLISKHIFYDRPVKFINTLTFWKNQKQKLISWVMIKLAEHKLEDVVFLLVQEKDFVSSLKKNCKLLAFEKEILEGLALISGLKYTINSPIITKYEAFLSEPESISVSFHFSKYIKSSSILRESLREDDPIKIWKAKSQTLNFNEVQENIIRKETQEIEELIQDSDFLTSFLRKYYNDTPSPKNSFEHQLKKHKIFLDNLFENLKCPEKFKELIEKRQSFLKDFNLVKADLLQRLDEVQYLKSHTYPNDFHKEEERLTKVLMHLDYLFSFLDQIFNGAGASDDQFQDEQIAELNFDTWGDKDEDPNNSKGSKGHIITIPSSPGSSKTPGLILNKSQTLSQKYKRKSEKLYLEKFSSLSSTNLKTFRGKPKESTISEQRNQCHKCRQYISRGLYFIGNNAVFCFYTGFWHCLDCISPNDSVIPYKAIEEFDLAEYSVSSEAKEEINELFDRVIINIPYASEVIMKNQIFYDFMILKREVHLIYNMICDEKLVETMLQDRLNLVLKENIFSLRNLCEIHDGCLPRILERGIKYLFFHFDSCQICQKRGSKCELCHSFLKIYAFDIHNTDICPLCKRLYHLKCIETFGCPFCRKTNL